MKREHTFKDILRNILGEPLPARSGGNKVEDVNDPSILVRLHAADEGCDLDDEVQWAKANPALGVFRDREDLASGIRKAIRMPAEEPKVRNLFLNQRVAPYATLISRAEWMACAGSVAFEENEQVFLGLDLSSVGDLTALCMVSAEDPARVKATFWKPSDWLVEHSHRDFGSGNNRYVEWLNAGHMRICPGRVIDPGVIAAYIADLSTRYQICGLAFDRWRMGDLLREFDRIGLAVWQDGDKGGSGLRIVPFGQGFVSMGPAIDALERAIMDRHLVHDNNPCLNWNMANAIAVIDPAGNRKIDKAKARFRIDGAVALAMALGLRSRDRQASPIDIEAMIA